MKRKAGVLGKLASAVAAAMAPRDGAPRLEPLKPGEKWAGQPMWTEVPRVPDGETRTESLVCGLNGQRYTVQLTGKNGATVVKTERALLREQAREASR